MNTEPTFLINTWTSWEEPPRARHQVSRELARRHPVHFVTRNAVGRPGIRSVQEEDNLWVIRPSWFVDYRMRIRVPILNELFQKWLFRQLFESHFRGSRPIVINFDHTATALARFCPDAIYYCNDDHIGNGPLTGFPVSAYHRRCEQKVAATSRFCIATSRYLHAKLSACNPNTHLITLGAPRVTFTPRPPGNLPGAGRRTVGLVGFINSSKVPIELINSLAGEDGTEVVLVGPISEDFRKGLRHPERVRLTGVLKGEELLRRVDEFDVAIAPYKTENSNKGVTPNKMWLYLALGKPVVVTDLPNLAGWDFEPGIIYRAGSDSDFVKLVGKASREDNERLFRARMSVAEENSWERKVDQLLSLVTRYQLRMLSTFSPVGGFGLTGVEAGGGGVGGGGVDGVVPTDPNSIAP